MKSRTVKTKIKQLVSAMGHYQAVANKLEIVLSYVYKLEKGTRPGPRLYKDIVKLHDEVMNSK